ncbi:MAG: hypothetical protein K8S23_07130 [Candidatus Cloacimonetes bacterium]|nr:hypothetical protein [Candidatus Cloacimonadota bacterium]
MKYIKKIIFFLSLFVLYIIFREFLELYVMIKQINPYIGYIFIGILVAFLIYFVIIPIIKLFSLPKAYGPVTDKTKEIELIKKRLEGFKKNKFLISNGINTDNLPANTESYNEIVKHLEKECELIRRKHVSQMFYSTSIAQNGFLDAIFILSGSINHIKSIFILYNGRVSNRDMFRILKKIYYAMAIGGSEGVEYATKEIFSKFATESLKSIPFIDKILASIADGLVNATLLTRISYITEKYCKLTYIESEKDLFPNPEFVIASAKHITSDIIDRIYSTIKELALEKSLNFALIAVNPIGFVLGKTIDYVSPNSISDEKKVSLKDHAKLIGNPIAYGFEKLYKSLKKR